jgi:hypothetical protein
VLKNNFLHYLNLKSRRNYLGIKTWLWKLAISSTGSLNGESFLPRGNIHSSKHTYQRFIWMRYLCSLPLIYAKKTTLLCLFSLRRSGCRDWDISTKWMRRNDICILRKNTQGLTNYSWFAQHFFSFSFEIACMMSQVASQFLVNISLSFNCIGEEIRNGSHKPCTNT